MTDPVHPASADPAPDLLRHMLEASGVAMIIRDRDFNAIYCNRAYLALYGYTMEEVRSTPIDSLIVGDDPEFQATIRPGVLAGEAWEGKRSIRTRSGKIVRVGIRLDPAKDAQGNVTHVVTALRRVRQSGSVRETLVKTEQHLKFLTDNTSDCLFRYLLPDRGFDYISPAVSPILGYSQQEFYDDPAIITRLVPPGWIRQLVEWKNDYFQGKAQAEYECPMLHKDGHEVWASLRFTLHKDEDGANRSIEGIATNIDEKKRARDALQASEAKYRFLAENISDVIWTCDNDYRLTYITPSAERIFGYPVEALHNLDYADIFPPQSLEAMKQAEALRAREEAKGNFGHVNNLSMEQVRADGERIWMETSITRIMDADGNPVGYQGLSRDITESRKAEAIIEENEARFRTLFEESPISLWEEDLTRLKQYFDELKDQGVSDFRQFFYDNPETLVRCAQLVDVVHVNKATLDLLRAKSREDLLGNLDKVLTESSMAAFTEEMILLASGGCEYCGEITHRTLDGDLIWVVVNFTVPEGYHDSLSRVIVSLIDVTPRKKAEQALMESEERYRVLVENSQEGVVVMQGRKAVFVNEAMADIFGYSPQKIMTMYPLDFVLPEDKESTLTQLRDFLNGKREEGFASCRVLTRTGKVRWLTIAVKPITWGGKEAHMEILTDVTVHKTLEDELRLAHAEMEDRIKKRTAELSEANLRLTREAREREKAQERIFSLSRQLLRIQEDERQRIARDLHDNVAQDLSSIVLGMETLFDGETGVPEVIRQRAEAVTEVIRNAIAEVRAISYGLRPPELEQFGLVRAMNNVCREMSDRSSTDIHFSAAGMESCRLDFDSEINLYRMVQESISNVVKHAQATQATVRIIRSHPDLILRIEDNGTGFDVAKGRAEALENRRMGLRSMEERARLIGGSMEIQSVEGLGTRIVFRVPVNTL